ncbi:ATP-binding protein [Marinobacter adhaerens]|jgi:ABC-type cobalamin/Fe3+-siderophores transport system ATPase subunit|uniref:ATP-binding protein n=2 Tax=Marinobacter adhaerens TaxID=1033846 RepID=A0ABX8IJU7_9GAMM|nr:ATP-binding protein [Marinobacter adhaerens]ADP98631.1 HypX [Marinobacter adhaerens HP15]MBW4976862.1 ATP-binding protein [Marinobacter adhaerens]QWV12619.1 ATP-binding protein [Marinobacter adhaerens]
MKGNLLGDIRAENDLQMLESAFLETSDYKAILESGDRCLVVGRRGTGKSALVYRLNKHIRAQAKTFVINVAPEEEQMIGLRSAFAKFSEKFAYVKAASKLCWRYAVYMEIISAVNGHYKLGKLLDHVVIQPYINEWKTSGRTVTVRLRKKIKSVMSELDAPEEIIGDLSDKLDLDTLEHALYSVFSKADQKIVILADRLDEGYSPDVVGIGVIDGFVQALIDLNSKYSRNVRAIAFLRDNMFRSIVINDPDFTRNIEGQVLRLHWDDYDLFNLVCNRLRIAINSRQENNVKVWNGAVADILKGREGFRVALRLTLYRPRDILVLLNNAFLKASSQDRNTIIVSDIEQSAKSVSENRLYDLFKEYENIFPALQEFVSGFSSGSAELSIEEANSKIRQILEGEFSDPNTQRDVIVLEKPHKVLQRLYGIGFVGIYDERSSSFVFCHDGRELSKEIGESSRLLVHPCYWLALNLKQKELSIQDAEDIHDEYDIEVSSISQEQRAATIGRIIEEIKEIPEGRGGAHDFEEWCYQAIKLVFAGSLVNIEMHPNKNKLQQRDIVATNMSNNSFWQRVFDDYKVRQVVFEIKNYEGLTAADYRQVNSYLHNDYGNLAFIVCRDPDNNLNALVGRKSFILSIKKWSSKYHTSIW